MTKSKRNKTSLHKLLVGEENCDFVIATISAILFLICFLPCVARSLLVLLER